jgi:hypothetical protein
VSAKPLLAAVAVGAICLAGCGSSTLSPSALRRSATRTCVTATAATQRIVTPTAPRGELSFLQQGITVLAPELGQLRRLRPGGAADAVYRQALQGLDDELRLLESAVTDLRHGSDPVDTIRRLAHDLAPVRQRQNAAWEKLGIPDCNAG